MPDPDKARIRHYFSPDSALRCCQKCGALLTANWERNGAHGVTEEDWGQACPYLECDAPDCRARRHPVTLEDWKAAAEHWQSHRLNGGCAHGC